MARVAKSEYQDMGNRISGMMYEAKRRKDITDDQLADRLGYATGTIRNIRHNKTACDMPFWKVMLIAQMAGYEVKFERKVS